MPAFGPGEALLALFRTDYYQMGYLAPKGADARIRAEGVEGFRRRVAALRPDLADRVDAIASLDDLHWLDVRLNRLHPWHINGLLCIGDAAHAMSPAGGVGINLAIQDAVAAAELLAPPLLRGNVTTADLEKVERRRRLPTVIVQTVQRIMQRADLRPDHDREADKSFRPRHSSWPGTFRRSAASFPGSSPSGRGLNTRRPSPDGLRSPASSGPRQALGRARTGIRTSTEGSFRRRMPPLAGTAQGGGEADTSEAAADIRRPAGNPVAAQPLNWVP